jgi:hypothetical protein
MLFDFDLPKLHLELVDQLTAHAVLDIVDLFVSEGSVHTAVRDAVRLRAAAGLLVGELIEQFHALHQVTRLVTYELPFRVVSLVMRRVMINNERVGVGVGVE